MYGGQAHCDSVENLLYQVKSGLLLNFAKFSEWPAAVWTPETTTLNFCIYQNTTLATFLTTALQDKRVKQRLIVIKSLMQPENFTSCHLIYINANQQDKFLPLLKGRPILTVGESSAFLSAGGMIAIIEESNRLGFSVNMKAVIAAGIKLSSDMLKLARNYPELAG